MPLSESQRWRRVIATIIASQNHRRPSSIPVFPEVRGSKKQVNGDPSYQVCDQKSQKNGTDSTTATRGQIFRPSTWPARGKMKTCKHCQPMDLRSDTSKHVHGRSQIFSQSCFHCRVADCQVWAPQRYGARDIVPAKWNGSTWGITVYHRG